MPDFNIHAIVLRRMQYAETDNILTLYSRERGRISAIAKGARKAVSRLSGACEVLNYSKFSLASARTLQIVRQAEVVSSYAPLREDLHRLANGLYIADLVGAFVDDGDPNPDLFDLLEQGLQLISTVQSPQVAARWFDLRLLNCLGYAPQLFECVYCAASLIPPTHSTSLSSAQGGALCYRHAHPQTYEDQSALDRPALFLLQSLDEAQGLNEEETAAKLNQLIPSPLASLATRKYIRYRIDRELKSLEFLDTVEG